TPSGHVDSASANRGRQHAGADPQALTDLGSGGHALGMQQSAREAVGLLFQNPANRLEMARSAFEAGDADSASRSAQAATQERLGAADAGRVRVGAVGGAALVLD